MSNFHPYTDRSPEECVCKLTSPELTRRKTTVITGLRKQVVETKETDHGFVYKFNGSDRMLDQLTEFIKTERQCCDFLTFTLFIAKEMEFIWLELAGPEGSKEFIKTELEL